MARVVSTSFCLHKISPFLQPSTYAPSVRTSLPFEKRSQTLTKLHCGANPNQIDYKKDGPQGEPNSFKDEPNQDTTASPTIKFDEFPNKDINRRVALGSIVADVELFLSSRLELGVSLKELTANVVTYDEVISLHLLSPS